MRIESSNVFMTGQTQFKQAYSSKEVLKVTNNNPIKAVSLENIMDDKMNSLSNRSKGIELNASEEEYELSEEEKQKISLLEKLFSKVFGKKVKFIIPKRIKLEENENKTKMEKILVRRSFPVFNNLNTRTIEFVRQEQYYENQKLSFNSTGTIKTQDGREINIDLELNMSRTFYSEKNVAVKIGQAIDPLVINYNNNAPNLTNKKYSFDLDNDGTSDQISFLTKGSGFLSLDKNNDGIINDGSELFGTESGDGFADLAKFDLDGNGWIDENDEIFDKLRIWVKDENGNDKLFALGEKGVGAIYLGNVNTDYSIKNNNNESLGEIRKTGIFLKENGQAGTIQHIDITL